MKEERTEWNEESNMEAVYFHALSERIYFRWRIRDYHADEKFVDEYHWIDEEMLDLVAN